MSLNIDYRLIYEVRKLGLRVWNKSNMRSFYENQAREKADEEYDKMVERLEQITGIAAEDLEFSDVACVADGVMIHVYYPAHEDKGVGKRKCIFCGLDDFDD